MRSTNRNDNDLMTTSSSDTPRKHRRFLRCAMAAAVAVGGIAAATGMTDAARAEPIAGTAAAPSSSETRSHALYGTLGVQKGLRLTQTRIDIGSGTDTDIALPASVDATERGAAVDFAYSTDVWFHQVEVEVTYHVEGTNEEVWLKFNNRPVLDDLTEFQVRDATTHLRAPNPQVKIGYEKTARENLSVYTH
jgi:hypothetical protein